MTWKTIRTGMSSKMIWIIIVVIVVIFGGGIFAYLVLSTGESLPFCGWWNFFINKVIGSVPLLRDIANFGCPFPK